MNLNLPSVIIGGIITLLAVFFTQILTHRNTLFRENRTLLQKKSEEIVKALFANYHWLHEQWLNNLRMNLTNHKEQTVITIPPIQEAIALQLIYFKELSEAMNIVNECHEKFHVRILQQQIQLMKAVDETDKLNNIKKEISDQASEDKLHQKYLDSMLSFIKESLVPSIPSAKILQNKPCWVRFAYDYAQRILMLLKH